jgi:hypothetical protein
MNKEIRIAKPNLGKRIEAFLLDVLTVTLGAFILYFAGLYGIVKPFTNYNENISKINQYETQYNLKMEYGEDYTKYEDVVQDIYFNDFTSNILKDYETVDKDFTIIHIYNINVLNLPANPTAESYSTSYYKYATNSDGSYNVDSIGVQIEGSGEYYERNLCDLFYESYGEMPALLRRYISDYGNAFSENSLTKDYLRVSALFVSLLVFYLVIPFTITKNGSTLFENINSIGFVNYKDSYRLKRYKIVLRFLIYSALPLLGIYLFTKYSIILIVVTSVFIDFLFVLLNSKNRDLFEIFTSSESVDTKESLIFDNKKDDDNYKNEEVSNRDYLEKLENFKDK